jgi:transposase
MEAETDLLPGQGHEVRAAPVLLSMACALGVVRRVVRERGYSSASWRAHIRAARAEPVCRAIPRIRPVAHDRAAYRPRHRVENLWAWLKEWRAVAARYDKTGSSYRGTLHIAAALDWLHNRPRSIESKSGLAFLGSIRCSLLE